MLLPILMIQLMRLLILVAILQDLSHEESRAEGALPSASSSDGVGADTESSQVAERSEVGSMIDSEVTGEQPSVCQPWAKVLRPPDCQLAL